MWIIWHPFLAVTSILIYQFMFFSFCTYIDGSNSLACRTKVESCLGSFSQLSGLLWPVVMLSLPGLSNKWGWHHFSSWKWLLQSLILWHQGRNYVREEQGKVPQGTLGKVSITLFRKAFARLSREHKWWNCSVHTEVNYGPSYLDASADRQLAFQGEFKNWPLITELWQLISAVIRPCSSAGALFLSDVLSYTVTGLGGICQRKRKDWAHGEKHCCPV